MTQKVMDILSYPITWRGTNFNSVRDTDGSNLRSAESDYYKVTRFDYSRLIVREQREPHHLIPGGDLGEAMEAFRFIALGIEIGASSAAKLEDRISALLSLFDVEECLYASPTTDGTFPLAFTSPTEVTGYTPTVAEYFTARPAGYPSIAERVSMGWRVPCAVELVCPDPRRYKSTLESIAQTGDPAVLAPNWTAGTGRTVHPILVLTMSGPGAANATFYTGGSSANPLVLDLSAAAAGYVVTVNMLTQAILVDGLPAASLRTSDVASYFTIPPGGAYLTAANTTGISTIRLSYHQARA